MPLGKRSDFGDAKYAGAESVFTCDIVGALQVRPTASHAAEFVIKIRMSLPSEL